MGVARLEEEETSNSVLGARCGGAKKEGGTEDEENEPEWRMWSKVALAAVVVEHDSISIISSSWKKKEFKTVKSVVKP